MFADLRMSILIYIHLADAFIQSDEQMRKITSNLLYSLPDIDKKEAKEEQ